MPTREERESALKIVVSSIARCEKMQNKFVEGTSQCSLLRNRIKALRIVQCLLKGEACDYDAEELKKALPPIRSIRSKTMNARKKHEEGSTWFQRLTPTIEAMETCEAQLLYELSRRSFMCR